MENSQSNEHQGSHDYNRIIIPSDLKSQICAQIADSTESLPLWQTSHRSSLSSTDGADVAAIRTRAANEDDVATPMPKKNDPMESTGAGAGAGAGAGTGASASATAVSGKDGAASKSGGGGLLLSTVSTRQSDQSLDKKEKSERPGTLRRLTTRIRRTISTRQD